MKFQRCVVMFFICLACSVLDAASASGLPSIDITDEFSKMVHADVKHAIRNSSASDVIKALKNKKIVGYSSDIQMDFSDYYIVRNSVNAFGARLYLVREESARPGLRGCCVNPGVELVLSSQPRLFKAMTIFSVANGCEFRAKVSIKNDFPLAKSTLHLLDQDLMSLNCTRQTLEDRQQAYLNSSD